MENQEVFLIKGGRPLQGEVKAAGAKNAASKMMIASLLTDEECVLENFPLISDSLITEQLCKALGSETRLEASTLFIKTPKIKDTQVTSLSR